MFALSARHYRNVYLFADSCGYLGSDNTADCDNFGEKSEKKGRDAAFLPMYSMCLRSAVPPILPSSMSAIDSLLSSASTNTTVSAASDRMNELTMSDFIKMMVAELENQDPMNPMSNTEMLQQISQIRSITSNDQLTSSIESLSLGQALSTASGLIGKTVTGVNSLGEEVEGKVDKVTIENGEAVIYVGNSNIKVGSITSIKE